MRWITLFALAVSGVAWSSLAADAESATAESPATAEGGTAGAAPGDEPAPELEGVVVVRENGFMTVTMEGPRAVLRFFDLQKKPVAPDVNRAFVKFHMTGRRPQNRTLLLADDGMSLTHGRVLRPPYTFKAFISLVKEAGGDEVADDDESGVVEGERHTVDFR